MMNNEKVLCQWFIKNSDQVFYEFKSLNEILELNNRPDCYHIKLRSPNGDMRGFLVPCPHKYTIEANFTHIFSKSKQYYSGGLDLLGIREKVYEKARNSCSAGTANEIADEVIKGDY